MNQQMFEPNSVRSLLKRRETQQLQSNCLKSEKKYTDPNIQYLAETRNTIKEIDRTIQDIRSWRENQKAELIKKLQQNKAIAVDLESVHHDIQPQQKIDLNKKLIDVDLINKLKGSQLQHQNYLETSYKLLDQDRRLQELRQSVTLETLKKQLRLGQRPVMNKSKKQEQKFEWQKDVEQMQQDINEIYDMLNN